MGKNSVYSKKSFSRSPFGRHLNHDLNLKIEANEKETNIYLYDEISWWGISAEDFVKDLNAIKTPIINLHVNSPGGSVFDGTAIYNAIKQHKSKVIAHIDGLAASIASVIVMSASEIRMGENAFLMIHEPFSIVIGTAQDMRAEADLLDKVSGTISKIYMNKSGKEEQEIKDMMAAETWFTAEEALEAKLIDKIYEDKEEEAKAKATIFDLSVFAHVPETLQATIKASKRDLESILRDAGCTKKQAQSIVAKSYSEDFRDEGLEDESLKDDIRDGCQPEPQTVLRDAAQGEKKKDKVHDLLIRAERIAPMESNAQL